MHRSLAFLLAGAAIVAGSDSSRAYLTVQQPAATAGPAARFDQWTILGPGGGGTMVDPTISPHDSRLVVERCDMTGAYITTDAGSSWRMFNLRTGCRPSHSTRATDR